MSVGLLLKETMSGWIAFQDDQTHRPFSFSIRAFTPRIFKLTAPRIAKGIVEFPNFLPDALVEGTLTIHLTGPKYHLEFELEKYGKVRLIGEKTYKVSKLRSSLITLPFKLYDANDNVIADGETVYRESILLFPFAAVRFVKEENAYSPELQTNQ